MAKKVAIALDNGFEEIEFSAILDVLRRAELDVSIVCLNKRQKIGAHGMKIIGDTVLSEVKDQTFDAVVLPGGLPGAQHLAESKELQAFIKRHADEGKITAAICAGPWALAEAGVLDGKTATCYPGFEDKIAVANHSETRVVIDGNIITSRGPGTAIEFALKLVEHLVDAETADALHEGMLVKS